MSIKLPDGYKAEEILEAIQDDTKNLLNYGIELHCLSDAKGNVRFFWRQSADKYVVMKPLEAKKMLVMRGVPNIKGISGMKVPDEILMQLQMDQALDYAGPLAGFDAGLHDIAGARILSLRSPRTPEAKEGTFAMLDSVLDAVFYDAENRRRFEAWAMYAYQYLHQRRWAPLPALAMAGPKNCGKTLIAYLMVYILGDTPPGKAMRFLRGDTAFNSDLAGSHVLLADDEISDTDMKKRKAVGQQIKALSVTTAHRIESKGVDSVTLSPHWRMIICTNDEPEHLQVLPPIDDGMADKILLLRCKTASMPMPSATPNEREAFFNALKKEVPAWLYAMSKREDLRCMGDGRQSVTGWQEETLLESMGNISSEAQLLEIIDLVEPWGEAGSVELTASELESQLTSFDSKAKHKATKLLSWNNACGSLLGHLCRRFPDRVSRHPDTAKRLWKISRPPMYDIGNSTNKYVMEQ
jgi:hypothetical protein